MPAKSKKPIIRIRLQRYIPERRKYEEILAFTLEARRDFFNKLADFERKVKRWLGDA